MPGSGSVDAVTVSRPESPRFDDTRIQDSFCDTSARRSDDSARQWQAKWDVQDSGLKELDIIQQNVKRLESQISDSRSLSRLLGDKVSDSRSLASISSSSGDESFRRLRRADSRQESNSQEPLIKAQVKMSRQLREEGCHLSAKRYILDAWAQACSGADISDNCLFLAASELLESGYLEDDPGELARCLDVAVSVNRFQRETIKVHRSSSRTPDALSRSSVLAHSVDDLPFSEGGDALSVFTGSVIGDDGDTASAQRSKQLEALVSLGIRLSKLVTAPVQVAQGRRFLADALHLAHQHPGINNDATWELVNFIVGEGYMEHVDETLRTTLNNVVSRLHQDDVSPKRLRQEGLAVQGLNACKAQLADEGSVSSVSGRREPENRTYISQDVLLKASPPGGGRDENVCADGHVYGRTPSRAGRLSEIQQANSLVQQTERALQILASPSKFLKGQPEPPPLPPRLARGGPDLIAGSQVVAEEESLESLKTSVDQGERSRTPDAVSGYAYLSQPVADATGNDAAGEDRDFVELVEYLKNVRLDSYASRLRREFGIRRVQDLKMLHGAATDQVLQFKLTKSGIPAAHQHKLVREAVRIKEGIKGTSVRQAKRPNAAADGRADTTGHGSRVDGVGVRLAPEASMGQPTGMPAPVSTQQRPPAYRSFKGAAVAGPLFRNQSAVSPVSPPGSKSHAYADREGVKTPPGEPPLTTPRSPPVTYRPASADFLYPEQSGYNDGTTRSKRPPGAFLVGGGVGSSAYSRMVAPPRPPVSSKVDYRLAYLENKLEISQRSASTPRESAAVASGDDKLQELARLLGDVGPSTIESRACLGDSGVKMSREPKHGSDHGPGEKGSVDDSLIELQKQVTAMKNDGNVQGPSSPQALAPRTDKLRDIEDKIFSINAITETLADGHQPNAQMLLRTNNRRAQPGLVKATAGSSATGIQC